MPKPPPITEAEWAIMGSLWADGAQSAQSLHRTLGTRQDWTLGTVKTLLSRLIKKGAISFEEDGKRYVYHAAVSQSACVKSAGRELMKRAKGSAKSPLLAFFLQEAKL